MIIMIMNSGSVIKAIDRYDRKKYISQISYL